MLKTPILFIIFNRPDLTKKVFEAIRLAKPKQLFIAADGPRRHKPEEALLCEETRKIIEKIDWDCEVKTLFRETNLGCQKAVAGAITWFFENVEEGIILEDDCLPVQSFFTYGELLLEKYRYDNKVMCISGDSWLRESLTDDSYYFTHTPAIWGWATWRRAWSLYDLKMKDYPVLKKQDFMKNIFPNKYDRQDWLEIFDKMYQNKIDTWDYIWCYTVFKKQGLCVIPNTNMIKNIGFDERATHTPDPNCLWSNKETKEINPHELIHPEKVQVSQKIQTRVLRERFGMSGKFSLKRYKFYCKFIREVDRIKKQMNSKLSHAK